MKDLQVFSVRNTIVIGDSAYKVMIVLAINEDHARRFHPSGRPVWDGIADAMWCNSKDAIVQKVGVAVDGWGHGGIICVGSTNKPTNVGYESHCWAREPMDVTLDF